MKRPTAIVATTIFEPAFLDGYRHSVEKHGRLDETTVYIIPDRKTPAGVAIAAAEARDRGFRVYCPSLEEQDAFLTRIGVSADFIPYNSDNRRNVGFLMALADGCEVLVSIDDDNFCQTGDDFVGAHHVVGQAAMEPTVRSSDNWFNICSLLEGWAGPAIFPRGFPYAAQKAARVTEMAVLDNPLKIAMNAGLWLDEPDVDAIFRLCRQPKIGRFTGKCIVLGPDVWSPINTQNTALTREAALTYYYVRMGFPLRGLSIDRFGDILSGYLTQKIIKHMGQGIRVGTPIVEHHRTPHNLFKDLYHELAGIVLIEEFVPWLIELKLEGSNSLDSYASLTDAIAGQADRFHGFIWDDGGCEFLRETASQMRTWIQAVQRL